MRATRAYTFLALFACAAAMYAQSYRSTVNNGNEKFRQQQLDEAKKDYSRAAAIEPERLESHFNLGNVAYRNSDYENAVKSYKKAGERAKSREEGAQIWYNAGDAFLDAAEKGGELPAMKQGAGAQGGGSANEMRMEGYRQAIRAFKEALKLNPEDEDARYNLAYAMKRLHELQQQNQQQNQKQDQKDKQKKDKEQKDQDKKKQDQDKQKQDQEQQNKDRQQNQPPPSGKPNQKKMSRQQAEQILNALQRDEKRLQEKLRQQRASRVNVDKDW